MKFYGWSVCFSLSGLAVVLNFLFLILTLSFIACSEEETPKKLNIESIEPTHAPIGATITILGTGFDPVPAKNQVSFFDDIVAEVTTSSTTALEVIVPAGALTGIVTVQVNQKTIQSLQEFTITPTISNFTPTSAVAGTTVTITGTGFSTIEENNEVTFNHVAAKVVEATPTSLNVTVPETGSNGQIMVKVGSQTTFTTEDFVFHPFIKGISPTVGAINRVVTITGSGFNLLPSNNAVDLNGQPIALLACSANQITLVVPQAATSGKISVTTSGHTAIGPSFEVVIEAMHAGGTQYESGYGITTDLSGNTFVTGSFNSTISFGSTTLTPDGEDIFIARYNSKAELQWAKKIGGPGSDRGISIVADNAGSCFVSGWYSTNSAFLAKLDENGSITWSNTFGTKAVFHKLAIQGNNLFVAGNFQGTLTMGTTTLTAVGGSDALLSKLDKNTGLPIWAKKFGGIADDNGIGLAISSAGQCYLSGSTFGNLTVGATTLTHVGELDAFLFKLDADGEPLWAKSIAGGQWENALGITLDESENPVVTGYFNNNTTIGNITLTGGGQDLFLAKFSSSNGAVTWATKAGGASNDQGEAITSDASGNLYVTGYFEFGASFGSINIPNTTSSRDIFVAKYNSQGVIQWVKRAGNSESDGGQSIAIGSGGVLHVTGYYRSHSVMLESTTIENAGADDVFIWKIWL